MNAVVPALIVLAVAVFLWRCHHKATDRAHRISGFPYAQLLDRRLAARHPHWTPAQRGLVFEGLRDYFLLYHDAKRRFVSMPSQAVDDAWHEFILFSRRYQDFCRMAFGRFLHHTPAEAMSTPTLAQDGIKRAWRLACRREDIDPVRPDRLPRLFALDALLEHPQGFRYALDCMAARTADPTAYCAGHIGCGSGCGGDGNGDSAGDGGDGGGGGCGGD